MRVEAYNQVAQLYNREKTQKVQNTKQMSTGRDEVQIYHSRTVLRLTQIHFP